MFSFFSKRNSLNEYETLSKRLIDLQTRILALEASEEVFRNKVLRKIQKPREEEEDLSKKIGGIIGYGNSTVR